jgi:hypothetical protein
MDLIEYARKDWPTSGENFAQIVNLLVCPDAMVGQSLQ